MTVSNKPIAETATADTLNDLFTSLLDQGLFSFTGYSLSNSNSSHAAYANGVVTPSKDLASLRPLLNLHPPISSGPFPPSNQVPDPTLPPPPRIPTRPTVSLTISSVRQFGLASTGDVARAAALTAPAVVITHTPADPPGDVASAHSGLPPNQDALAVMVVHAPAPAVPLINHTIVSTTHPILAAAIASATRLTNSSAHHSHIAWRGPLSISSAVSCAPSALCGSAAALHVTRAAALHAVDKANAAGGAISDALVSALRPPQAPLWHPPLPTTGPFVARAVRDAAAPSHVHVTAASFDAASGRVRATLEALAFHRASGAPAAHSMQLTSEALLVDNDRRWTTVGGLFATSVLQAAPRDAAIHVIVVVVPYDEAASVGGVDIARLAALPPPSPVGANLAQRDACPAGHVCARDAAGMFVPVALRAVWASAGADGIRADGGLLLEPNAPTRLPHIDQTAVPRLLAEAAAATHALIATTLAMGYGTPPNATTRAAVRVVSSTPLTVAADGGAHRILASASGFGVPTDRLRGGVGWLTHSYLVSISSSTTGTCGQCDDVLAPDSAASACAPEAVALCRPFLSGIDAAAANHGTTPVARRIGCGGVALTRGYWRRAGRLAAGVALAVATARAARREQCVDELTAHFCTNLFDTCDTVTSVLSSHSTPAVFDPAPVLPCHAACPLLSCDAAVLDTAVDWGGFRARVRDAVFCGPEAPTALARRSAGAIVGVRVGTTPPPVDGFGSLGPHGNPAEGLPPPPQLQRVPPFDGGGVVCGFTPQSVRLADTPRVIRVGDDAACPFPFAGASCTQCALPPLAAAYGASLATPDCGTWQHECEDAGSCAPGALGGVLHVVSTHIEPALRGTVVGTEVVVQLSVAVDLPTPKGVAVPCSRWFDGFWEGARCFFVSATELRARAPAHDAVFTAWATTAATAAAVDGSDPSSAASVRGLCASEPIHTSARHPYVNIDSSLDRRGVHTGVPHTIRPLAHPHVMREVAIAEDSAVAAARAAGALSLRAVLSTHRIGRPIRNRFEEAILTAAAPNRGILTAPFTVRVPSLSLTSSTMRVVRVDSDTSDTDAPCGTVAFAVAYEGVLPGAITSPLYVDPTVSAALGGGNRTIADVPATVASAALGNISVAATSPPHVAAHAAGIVWWVAVGRDTAAAARAAASRIDTSDTAGMDSLGGTIISVDQLPVPLAAACATADWRALPPDAFVDGTTRMTPPALRAALTALAIRAQAATVGSLSAIVVARHVVATASSAAAEQGLMVQLKVGLIPHPQAPVGPTRPPLPHVNALRGWTVGTPHTDAAQWAPLQLAAATGRATEGVELLARAARNSSYVARLPCGVDAAYPVPLTGTVWASAVPTAAVSLAALAPVGAPPPTHHVGVYLAGPMAGGALDTIRHLATAHSGAVNRSADGSLSWILAASGTEDARLAASAAHAPWAATAVPIEAAVDATLFASTDPSITVPRYAPHACPSGIAVVDWHCQLAWAPSHADSASPPPAASAICHAMGPVLSLNAPPAGLVITATASTRARGAVGANITVALAAVATAPPVALHVTNSVPTGDDGTVDAHPIHLPVSRTRNVQASAQRVFVDASQPSYLHAAVGGPCNGCTYHWAVGDRALSVGTQAGLVMPAAPAGAGIVEAPPALPCDPAAVPTARPLGAGRVGVDASPASPPPSAHPTAGEAAWCVHDRTLHHSDPLRALRADPLTSLGGTTCGTPFVPLHVANFTRMADSEAEVAMSRQPLYACGACAHGVDGVAVSVEVRMPGTIPRKAVARVVPTEGPVVDVVLALVGAAPRAAPASSPPTWAATEGSVVVIAASGGSDAAPVGQRRWGWAVRGHDSDEVARRGGYASAALIASRPALIAFTERGELSLLDLGSVATRAGVTMNDAGATMGAVVLSANATHLTLDASGLARLLAMTRHAYAEIEFYTYAGESSCSGAARSLYLMTNAPPTASPSIDSVASLDCVALTVNGLAGPVPTSLAAWQAAPLVAGASYIPPTSPPPAVAPRRGSPLHTTERGQTVGLSASCGRVYIDGGIAAIRVATDGWVDDRTPTAQLEFAFGYRIVPPSEDPHDDFCAGTADGEEPIGDGGAVVPPPATAAAARGSARVVTAFRRGRRAVLPIAVSDSHERPAGSRCLRAELFVIARDSDGAETLCTAATCRPRVTVMAPGDAHGPAAPAADDVKEWATALTSAQRAVVDAAPATAAAALLQSARASGVDAATIRSLLLTIRDAVQEASSDSFDAVAALTRRLTRFATSLTASDRAASAAAALQLLGVIAPRAAGGPISTPAAAAAIHDTLALLCACASAHVAAAERSQAVRLAAAVVTAWADAGASDEVVSRYTTAFDPCDGGSVRAAGRGIVTVVRARGARDAVAAALLATPAALGRIDVRPLSSHPAYASATTVSVLSLLAHSPTDAFFATLTGWTQAAPGAPAQLVRVSVWSFDGAAEVPLTGTINGDLVLADLPAGGAFCVVSDTTEGGRAQSAPQASDGSCTIPHLYEGLVAAFASASSLDHQLPAPAYVAPAVVPPHAGPLPRGGASDRSDHVVVIAVVLGSCGLAGAAVAICVCAYLVTHSRAHDARMKQLVADTLAQPPASSVRMPDNESQHEYDDTGVILPNAAHKSSKVSPSTPNRPHTAQWADVHVDLDNV